MRKRKKHKKNRAESKAGYEGYFMSLKQIAVTEGLSLMQVRWTLSQAMKKLKIKYKNYNGIY